MTAQAFALALAAILVSASPAMGHHSDAGVDMSKVVSFEGTVKEFVWNNPHVYFLVDVKRDGQAVTWDVQMANLSGLARKGWTPTTLRRGDSVTVRAHPASDGRTYGILESVEKAGGLALAPAVDTPAVTPAAKTIAGRWLCEQ